MRAAERTSTLGRVTLVLLASFLYAQTAGAQCQPPYRIEWPAANPVWTMCWLPPDQSSGPSGSGLELRYARYKGKLMFWRASMPVLNVLYDAGSGWCGPTYRDWLNELQAFDADNVLQPGYAEPTHPPTTVCDHPGSDSGTFAGVAVEKLADRLVLTTQTRAGWYRYIQKLVFRPDGSVEPQLGFTAVTHPCTSEGHTHHGYWRFDLDIDGAANDRVQERRKFLFFHWWRTLNPEASRLRNAGNSRRWRVRDRRTLRGVEIRPGALDAPGGDPFGGSDVWALRYHGTETDDGGSTGGALGDAQHIDPYVNGEGIDGQDVVVWYRVGFRHEHGPACHLVGPRLAAIGSW
jgi:hypothetical protein